MQRGECLILLTLLLALTLDGVDTDLFVVLLKGSQILTGLGELALLHTLTHVPVDESALGVHQIELVIQTGPGLGDGGGVAQHAHGTLHLGQVTAGHHGGWLVVDSDLETSWAPVDELDGALGLDGGDGGVDVLGDNITTVQHAAGHVLAVAGVALDHLVGRLEAGVGDLSHRQLLVVGLLGGDDGSVGGQGEVDTGVGHQVGLELGQIDVQSTIKTQGSGDGGHDLADQTVEVGVGGTLDVQVTAADVVDSLVVDHEGAVGVLQGGVGGQDGVVGLNHGGGDLGGGVDGELQLGLLAVVDGQTLHQQGGEARAGAATEGVEDEEALQTGALVSQLADSVENQVNDLLADGVVATGVVVGSILLAGDQLLGVEQLTVGAGADLINNGGLQIDEDGTGDVLASAGLAEEGVEGVITTADGLVGGHLAVRLDAVLQAVQLPAGIADLDSGLADVDGDTLAHVDRLGRERS
eukprot:GHVL01016352.1.p1 GENE.GHVL01016352.1~~GHVL01016352.1.p1  ORF type:complete len:468 (-),score=45.07 GHVL01016352.1:77-1480(-)